MDLSNIAYNLCLIFIEVYKWIELQVLKLFSKQIARKGKELGEKIGIAFHFPDEINGNNDFESSWTEEDEKRILAKCNYKYDKVLHIKVHKPEELFVRIANRGTLGNGEAYMDGLWDVGKSDEDISEMAKRMLENNYQNLYYNPWNQFLCYLELYAFNLQTKQRSFQVGKEHYDLGNDLYELMLDPWMQYTCAYWAKAKNLNEAQEHKLELIAKKLDLKPGMRVLDIGCGWGTLCKYLAQHYGVECVGVTISAEGAAYGQKINEGLPVDIRLQDYRDLKNETFDRVVSIGCLEHVGFKNYHEFFKVAHKCLKDDGIFLVHSIAVNHKNMMRSEPWLHKYIFPNGNLPFPKDITRETEGLFIIEDWHNFGPDYARTLRAWRDNFVRTWPQIEGKYGDRFYRMWIMYLSLCVGVFTSRRGHLWQIVLSKDGLKTDYRAAR